MIWERGEMELRRKTGRFCKSCGMPMSKPEDFGTNAFGTMSKEYCLFCFQDGKFINSKSSMLQMIERVSSFRVTTEKIPQTYERKIEKSFKPRLKRWQEKAESDLR